MENTYEGVGQYLQTKSNGSIFNDKPNPAISALQLARGKTLLD